jgi:uncharacterized membrane protein
VEEVYPDERTSLFNLVDSFHVATAIISSSTTTPILPIINFTFETSTINLSIPIVDNLYHQERVTQINVVPQLPHQSLFEWLYNKLTYFGIRGLIIGSTISISLLLFLLFLIIHLHCKTRHTKKKLSHQYNQTNGNKTYSQIKRCSIPSPDGRHSKKHVPKFLRYLQTNQSKQSPFRLASNGTISRLNSGDSYHLISSIQENHKDKIVSTYKNSDCVLNEHCCLHTNLSQPIPSMYHQVNRLMMSGNEPNNGTLRSLKKEIDNSSAQTYSAVYSCELAANLDLDQEFYPQHRSSIKRRSILKTNNNSVAIQSQILFLYMKNLVDCYALQPNNHQTVLLATADDNRIQLSHLRVSSSSNQTHIFKAISIVY